MDSHSEKYLGEHVGHPPHHREEKIRSGQTEGFGPRLPICLMNSRESLGLCGFLRTLLRQYSSIIY